MWPSAAGMVSLGVSLVLDFDLNFMRVCQQLLDDQIHEFALGGVKSCLVLSAPHVGMMVSFAAERSTGWCPKTCFVGMMLQWACCKEWG